MQEFEKIGFYLKSTWSEKEKLFTLSNFKKNLRRCVVTKQTTIYYKEVDSKIYIVSLYVNRRNPESAA